MTNAYELLSTPDKRKQYDDYRFLSGGNSNGGNSSDNTNTGFNKGPGSGSFWKGSDYQRWSQQREK